MRPGIRRFPLDSCDGDGDRARSPVLFTPGREHGLARFLQKVRAQRRRMVGAEDEKRLNPAPEDDRPGWNCAAL